MKLIVPCLFLLAHLARARPVAEDFVVKGLIDVEPAFASFEGDMFAGVLPTEPANDDDQEADEGHLMFWYFDAEKPQVDDSLIVWFNGGPGEDDESIDLSRRKPRTFVF